MRKWIVFFVCLASLQSLHALTYPQLAVGGGFEAVLFFTNKTPFPWEGTAFLRQGANSAWDTPWKVNGIDATGFIGFSVKLDPYETWKATLEGDDTPRSGYLVLEGSETSSTEDVVSSYFFNWRSPGGELIDSTGVSPSESGYRFMFSVEKDSMIDTGFALAPDLQTEPFGITATLYDSAGNVHDQETINFTGHRALFVSDLFEGLDDGFVGMIHLESPSRIYLAVLRLQLKSASDFQLTSIPADTSVP